jgi:hypothetical protein
MGETVGTPKWHETGTRLGAGVLKFDARGNKLTCMASGNSIHTGTFYDESSTLLRERAQLQEEVMQLKAAVNIWTEVCRSLQIAAKLKSPCVEISQPCQR